MFPIIAVGLSSAAKAVLDRISGERAAACYDTAEEALWQLGTDANPTVCQVGLDARGRLWSCHVMYGDAAMGAIVTHTEFGNAVPHKIPCQGLKIVITDTLGSDPTLTYRVVEGQPESREGAELTSLAVMKQLPASMLLVVDKLGETPDWEVSVARALFNADADQGQRGSLGFVPGAEAKVELAKLEALRARGLTRPGHFEQKGRV